MTNLPDLPACMVSEEAAQALVESGGEWEVLCFRCPPYVVLGEQRRPVIQGGLAGLRAHNVVVHPDQEAPVLF